MRDAVGDRERAAPRPAEHEPALDPEMMPQTLEVVDEQRCGVVAQFSERARAAGTALVVDDDAIVRRIKKTAVSGCRPGPRTPMQENDRHALRIAAFLPVHLVNVVEAQKTGAVRLDFGVELAADGR